MSTEVIASLISDMEMAVEMAENKQEQKKRSKKNKDAFENNRLGDGSVKNNNMEMTLMVSGDSEVDFSSFLHLIIFVFFFLS